MKGLNKFPDEYFLKYKEKPVILKPYDPQQEIVAHVYLARLRKIFEDQEIKLLIRGSTAFKILGKGEVEVGVYPQKTDWRQTRTLLTRVFGEPENVEVNYLRFNDQHEEVEVEIIVLKGHEAEVDIKLHQYLLAHPKLLKEYEQVKKKSSFSKREYQKQKNKFLTRIIAQIPEN